MVPKTVKRLAKEWGLRLSDRDITSSVRDDQQITAKEGDILYLDPTYETGEGRYYAGPIDVSEFFSWLRTQHCDYDPSLNGFLGDEDRRLDVPTDLYDTQLLIENGDIQIDRIAGRVPRQVSESLYIRRRSRKADLT